MADLKISQLTAVTTPLAGTEVLPIVQSSSTKKATVSEILNSTQPTQSAYGVTYLNASKIQETGSTLQFVSGELRVNTNGAALKVGGFDGYLYGTGSGTSKVQFSNGNADVFINGSTSLNLQSAGNTRISIASGGDVTLSTGNIIQGTAAKGINFTANTNAPGMTSELLNWYEEGTWTPAQGGGLTVVGAFSSTGRYTRIGRQVTVSGTVTGATSVAVTAAGIVTTNLPFTVGTAGHGNATDAAVTASAAVICTTTNVTSASAIAATGTITFSATYFVGHCGFSAHNLRTVPAQ